MYGSVPFPLCLFLGYAISNSIRYLCSIQFTYSHECINIIHPYFFFYIRTMSRKTRTFVGPPIENQLALLYVTHFSRFSTYVPCCFVSLSEHTLNFFG